MRIYIAGPYTAPTADEQGKNIERARDAAAELYRKGHVPFSPHTMTAWFDHSYPDIPRKHYLETDLEWLELCDAILMLPGWQLSNGACAEHKLAESLGLQIFYSLDEVPDVSPCGSIKVGFPVSGEDYEGYEEGADAEVPNELQS